MTNFGICVLSVIPVRKKASDKAEMVTQLLFGDIFTVKETEKDWLFIEINDDKYEGWIDKKQASFISENDFNDINQSPKSICLDIVNTLESDSKEVQPIVFGSSFPNFIDQKFEINHTTYNFTGYCKKANDEPTRDLLVENAIMFLNTPYLWGGKTPFGIDCSGFTQIIYKSIGINIPRDAAQQVDCGNKLSLMQEASPGDLLFFGKSEENISHVGILLSNNKIIHASGKVRVDLVDHFGIFNQELRDYSHKLRALSTFF